MWIKEHSKEYTGVSKDAAWKIMTDINTWPTWHDDLEYCKLEGPFKEGATFLLKPKGAPKVNIKITEVKEGISFTDCTPFFGAKMYNTHMIEKSDNGILLKNKLVVTGPLRWLWSKLVQAS